MLKSHIWECERQGYVFGDYFFFNDTATTEIYTLSLHDALPIRPYREHDATKPRSVYGRTKLEGENAARTAPRHLIVRTSWVFGEGRNFVSAIVDRARQGGALQVVADQIGRPTYAPDL